MGHQEEEQDLALVRMCTHAYLKEKRYSECIKQCMCNILHQHSSVIPVCIRVKMKQTQTQPQRETQKQVQRITAQVSVSGREIHVCTSAVAIKYAVNFIQLQWVLLFRC